MCRVCGVVVGDYRSPDVMYVGVVCAGVACACCDVGDVMVRMGYHKLFYDTEYRMSCCK